MKRRWIAGIAVLAVLGGTGFIGSNVITTEHSDWATNCPEYKVTAVQVTKVSQPSAWQKRYRAFSKEQQALLEQSEPAHGSA